MYKQNKKRTSNMFQINSLVKVIFLGEFYHSLTGSQKKIIFGL